MYNKQLGVWVDTASLAEVEVKGTRRTPNETLERNKEIFEKFIQRDLMMHRMEKPVPPPFSEKNIPPVNEPHIQAPQNSANNPPSLSGSAQQENNINAAANPPQTDNQPVSSNTAQTQSNGVGSAELLRNINDQANSGASNVENLKGRESARLNKIHGLKHDLQAEFSHNMVKFQNNELTGSSREFYAKNYDVLAESIYDLRHDAQIIQKQYGDFAAHTYTAAKIGKITGWMGTIADFAELGTRIQGALAYDRWDPVLGQVSKMVTSAAATTVALGVIRAVAVGVFGVSAVAAGPVLIGTVVLGGLATYGISILTDELEKEISNGNYWDKYFSDAPKGSETGLALSGNHHYKDDVTLKADHVVLMGRHQFDKSLNVESKTTTLIMDTQAKQLNIHSDKTYTVKSHHDDDAFYRQLHRDQAEEQAAGRENHPAEPYTLSPEPELVLPESGAAQVENPPAQSTTGSPALSDLTESGGSAEQALEALSAPADAPEPNLPESKAAYSADALPVWLPEQAVPPVL